MYLKNKVSLSNTAKYDNYWFNLTLSLHSCAGLPQWGGLKKKGSIPRSACGLSHQLCPTPCDAMDCSLPSSSMHGTLLARILEWVAIPFSRGSSQPQGSNPGLSHCGWILYHRSHQGSPRILEWVAYPFSSGPSQPNESDNT